MDAVVPVVPVVRPGLGAWGAPGFQLLVDVDRGS
jgi:hypothetical protein